MVLEVYMGSRPGRPRLALVLAASALVGSLGLAWVQVRGAHALGPEQRIPGTPLVVRVPRDWVRDSDDPQRFLLPSRERRRAFGFERRITFVFERFAEFRPPEQRVAGVQQVRPARIGRYDAIEVRRAEQLRFGRVVIRRESVQRVTCLPRGEVIVVLYEPLDELRPADLEILDEICAELRIEDAALTVAPAEALRRAGLDLPLERGWQAALPVFEEAPGLYLGGSEGGRPVWALGIFRTWLAAGRTPEALLADLAAEQWLVFDSDRLLHRVPRSDREAVGLRHPRFGLDGEEPLPAAWVVPLADNQAVLMLVYAAASGAAAADEIAGRLAAAVTITAPELVPPIAAAQAAGEMLVAQLEERGPVPRWGRASVKVRYEGTSLRGTELLVTTRAARDQDPQHGYEGGAVLHTEGARGTVRESLQSWTTGRTGTTYTWEFTHQAGDRGIKVEEKRARARGPVIRTVAYTGGRERQWTVTPGPGFVPPPLESIISGWVARGEAEAALVEQSSLLGPGTHTVLLRRLPADGNYPRVFQQQDYWPLGELRAFDDDLAEPQWFRLPHAEYHRVNGLPGIGP